MKSTITIIILLFFYSVAIGKKYDLKLINEYEYDCQITFKIIDLNTGLELDTRNYAVSSNSDLIMNFKIKKNEAVKITGSFDSDFGLYEINLDQRILKGNVTNEIYLKGVVSISNADILTPADIVESISKDEIQKFINDTLTYNPDRFPPLGSFIFVEDEIPVLPNYIDHEHKVDQVNVKSFVKRYRISKSKSSGLDLTYGKIANLYASLSSDQMMDYYWSVDSLYVQRWKPTNGESVYDLLRRDDAWYQTVYDKIKDRLDDISKFKLYFVNAQSLVKGLKQGTRIYSRDSTNFGLKLDTSISDQVLAINAFGQWVTTSDYVEAILADKLLWKVYVQDLTSFVHNQIIRDNMTTILQDLQNQVDEINGEMEMDTTRLINAYTNLRNANFMFPDATPDYLAGINDNASKFDFAMINSQNLENQSLETVLPFYSDQELNEAQLYELNTRINIYNNVLKGFHQVREELEQRIINRTNLVFQIQQSSVQYSRFINETIKSNARNSKELESTIFQLLAEESLASE